MKMERYLLRFVHCAFPGTQDAQRAHFTGLQAAQRSDAACKSGASDGWACVPFGPCLQLPSDSTTLPSTDSYLFRPRQLVSLTVARGERLPVLRCVITMYTSHQIASCPGD